MGSCATSEFSMNQRFYCKQTANKIHRCNEARTRKIQSNTNSEACGLRWTDEVTDLRLYMKRSPSQSLRSRSCGHGVSEDMAKVASLNFWTLACPAHLEDSFTFHAINAAHANDDGGITFVTLLMAPCT